MTDISYVLPIRRSAGGDDLVELTEYLRWLSQHVELVIVDGSDPDRFDEDAQLWGSFSHHLRPDPASPMRNGKAWGVHTGMAHVSNEFVVIADDDVRYGLDTLRAVGGALVDADLVRPQNYFDPLPWHAAWDTARSLINRAFHHDSPGTLAIRCSTYRAMGGYDGNVLYENCELARTVAASGGRVVDYPDLYVPRLPPTVGRFFGQRTRQAYDDFAQPLRLAVFLGALPMLVRLLAAGRWRTATFLGVVVPVGLAEVGRRRSRGAAVFPVTATLWAPAWCIERSVCSWLAVISKLRGGVRYGGQRLAVAAHSTRRLRRSF